MSSEPSASWYRTVATGVDIRVRLTPKGGADRIDGEALLSDGSRVLAVRVRAAPEKGAANDALERTVAEAIGVARATVTVASGHRGRRKTVHVACGAAALADVLAELGKLDGGP